MAIGGEKREEKNFPEFTKRIGLFEARVLSINPDKKEYEKKNLGRPLDDDKELEYLSESDEGNTKLRIDVYLEDVNEKQEEGEEPKRYRMSFFLEDKERVNKDGDKKQYINSIGTCSWASSPNELREWFTGKAGEERSYRVAKVGEEELYTFVTSWLGKLDYKNSETIVDMDWKTMMKGNLKELKNEIEGDWCGNFLALATVRVKESEDGVREYQSVYNKAFLPVYSMRNFRLMDYDDEEQIQKLQTKREKKSKMYYHERFVLDVKGDYGCRDIHILKPIQDYDPDAELASTNETIQDDDASY